MTPILVYAVFTASLFIATNIYFHFFTAFIILSLLFMLPLNKVKNGLLPIAFFLVFTFGGNLFFHSGRIIYDAGFFSITDEGLRISGIRALRVFSMIFGAKILTHLSPVNEIVQAIERTFRPLEKTGLPVKDFFSVMGLTLKAFPVLVNYISKAYREDVKSGEICGFRGRIRHMVFFLMPIFIKSIRSPESFFVSESDGTGH